MDKEDWLNGDLCEKDGLSFCAACKPNEFSPIVYVTSNGSAFHQSKDCEWLLKGIKRAKKRWKLEDDVRVAPKKSQTAISEGYNPCNFCCNWNNKEMIIQI